VTPHATTVIAVTKSVTLVLGGLISYLAYRAYQRTGGGPLRALAVGFAVVTVGSIVGGVVDLFTAIDLAYGVVAESVLTAVGFGVITYSLYAK
jgi:hypothetical protein